MINRNDLLTSLQNHIGANNGISAEQLARQHACEKRHVRTLVSELRTAGIAVCGHPRTGYFIAATPEELEETCQFLRSRAMHSLQLESALRQVPLPDLLGQMRLRT